MENQINVMLCIFAHRYLTLGFMGIPIWKLVVVFNMMAI